MREITTLVLLLLLAWTGMTAQPFALVYQGYQFYKTTCGNPMFEEGDTITISAGIPEMYGKKLSHWEFDGNQYKPSDTFIMPAKDVVLVPVWESGTAVENIQDTNSGNYKLLENGVLYIINNGVKYNGLGERVQ